MADQKADGQDRRPDRSDRSPAYDQLDRYDFDGDGNFDEPDGYIDRFQIVHAGGDQADGDPIQGEDAIWSHRWYAYYTDQGVTGPATNQLGGTQIGNTGIWVGDYTIRPENGGLSVIAHEYGHDLGLPDHYDTAASGDNPVSWWNLMAQSRVSDPGDQGIGTRAAATSACGTSCSSAGSTTRPWWPARSRRSTSARTSTTPNKAQGVAVVLPDKEVTDHAARARRRAPSSGGAARATTTPRPCRASTSPSRPPAARSA